MDLGGAVDLADRGNNSGKTGLLSSPLTSPISVGMQSPPVVPADVICTPPRPNHSKVTCDKQTVPEPLAIGNNPAVPSLALIVRNPATPVRPRKPHRPRKSLSSDDDDSSAETPPPRHHKDMFGTFNSPRFLGMPHAGLPAMALPQLTSPTRYPIVPVISRLQEKPRNHHDTPQQKLIIRRRPLRGLEMDADDTAVYDISYGDHAPCPDNPDGRPWVVQFPDISNEQWRPQTGQGDRFTRGFFPNALAPFNVRPNAPAFGNAPPSPVPSFRKPSAVRSKPAQRDLNDLLDGAISMDDHGSHEEDDYIPVAIHKTPGPSEIDDVQSPAEPTRTDKGKAPERNAAAGPSGDPRGRPTVGVNEELERIGHRMQGEVADLAEKFSMSYSTVLRKIGFSRHQEVREPNLANIFRKVHKHRLIAESKG